MRLLQAILMWLNNLVFLNYTQQAKKAILKLTSSPFYNHWWDSNPIILVSNTNLNSLRQKKRFKPGSFESKRIQLDSNPACHFILVYTLHMQSEILISLSWKSLSFRRYDLYPWAIQQFSNFWFHHLSIYFCVHILNFNHCLSYIQHQKLYLLFTRPLR